MENKEYVVIEKEWERFVDIKNSLVEEGVGNTAACQIVAGCTGQSDFKTARNTFVATASNLYKYLLGNCFTTEEAAKIVIDYMNSHTFAK